MLSTRHFKRLLPYVILLAQPAFAGGTGPGAAKHPQSTLTLGDDDYAEMALPFAFPFFGQNYASVFVHANGFISFGAPSDEPFLGAFESVSALLSDPPRIAALWDDLNPAAGGTITAGSAGGAFRIVFTDVPEYAPVTGGAGANTFAFVLRPDGTFRLEFGTLTAQDGLAGRSAGGSATDPGRTDLSAAAAPIHGPQPSDAVYENFSLLAGHPNDLSGAVLEFAATVAFQPPTLAAALAGQCYGTTGFNATHPGVLLSIDPASGAGQLLGATGFSEVTGLAIDSGGGIYGTFTGGFGTALLRISATNGFSRIAGSITSGPLELPFVEAIAFDAQGTLYGIDGFNDLYTIDPATAEATLVGPTGIDPFVDGFLIGLAIEPGTGRLLASSDGFGSAPKALFEIDPATGHATRLGPTGLSARITDLLFANALLYGTVDAAGNSPGRPSDFAMFDPGTGAGTRLGPTGFSNVSGLASFEPTGPESHAYVFLAGDNIKIDGNAVSEGDMHANGNIRFGPGKPGRHVGTLTARGDITLAPGNTIEGDVTAGDDLFLQGDASVVGQAAGHAPVPAVSLPPLQFSSGGEPRTVPAKTTLALAPGRYGKVKIEKQATLFLSTGDYFVDEFDTDRGATLVFDVAGGMVRIHVTGLLEFDDRVEVVITPDGETGSRFVRFETRQQVKVDIGKGCRILGTLVVPAAEVHFSSGCAFRGAVYAAVVTLEPGVPFLPHSSPHSLPKPDDLLAEEDASPVSATPGRYLLHQNFPNPFNPRTVIPFTLPAPGVVEIAIYSSAGRQIRQLIAAPFQPGRHETSWDGKDTAGRIVASGVYLLRLHVNGFAAQRKLLLLR